MPDRGSKLPQVFDTPHMALNLLRQAKPTLSLKNLRKRAGWNTEYLATLVQQT